MCLCFSVSLCVLVHLVCIFSVRMFVSVMRLCWASVAKCGGHFFAESNLIFLHAYNKLLSNLRIVHTCVVTVSSRVAPQVLEGQ